MSLNFVPTGILLLILTLMKLKERLGYSGIQKDRSDLYCTKDKKDERGNVKDRKR